VSEWQCGQSGDVRVLRGCVYEKSNINVSLFFNSLVVEEALLPSPAAEEDWQPLEPDFVEQFQGDV